MNTKQWIPILVAFLMAFGSVQAFADSSWNYDENSETVNYSFNGSPVTQSSSHPEEEGQSGIWYYDEVNDIIAFNVEGSRSQYVRENPSIDSFESDYNLAFLDQ